MNDVDRSGSENNNVPIDFRQAVTITYLDMDDAWDCYFIQDDHGGFEHAQHPTLDAAIAWGRVRCERVRVWDPDTSTAPYV